MSWVRSFDFVRIENQSVMIAVKSGHRDLAKFFNEKKKTQLADLIQTITGKRIRIELVKAEPQADTAYETKESPAAPHRPGRVTTEQRRDAMNLSLVKAISDLFETQLIDVRKEYNDEAKQKDNPEDTGESEPDAESESEDDHV